MLDNESQNKGICLFLKRIFEAWEPYSGYPRQCTIQRFLIKY